MNGKILRSRISRGLRSFEETPQDFFDHLNAEFQFTLDVCASKKNAKCRRYFTKKDDGLIRPWHGVCWCNPPYGNGIGKWVRRAYDESFCGVTTVLLVPSSTDSKWWHEYAMLGEIRFVRGRLKFQGAKHSANFASSILVFRRKN